MTIGALTIPPILFLYFAVFLAEYFLYKIKSNVILILEGILSVIFSVYGIYIAVQTRTTLHIGIEKVEGNALIDNSYIQNCIELYDKAFILNIAAVILFSMFLIIATCKELKYVHNHMGRWIAGIWFLMQIYALAAGLKMASKGFDFGSYVASGVFHISLMLHLTVFICMLIKRRKEKWGIK